VATHAVSIGSPATAAIASAAVITLPNDVLVLELGSPAAELLEQRDDERAPIRGLLLEHHLLHHLRNLQGTASVEAVSPKAVVASFIP
jgi:hypothetical protein